MTRFGPSSAIAAILALATLGGCFDDPYARPLAELDLGDAVAVAQIAATLGPEDRGLFKTYALRHSAQTRYACGNTGRHATTETPETIREALEMTRRWEAEDAARKAASAEPDLRQMTPEDRFEYELEQLRIVYREVDDRQANIIAANEGGNYRDSELWKQSERDMEEAVARIREKQAQRP